MKGYLGQSLILIALIIASFGAVVSVFGAKRQNETVLKISRYSAYGYFWAMLLANLVMVWALLTNDFSVSYVAQVGSRATPAHISVVSLWSSLEGSILFWGAVLGIYLAFFAKTTRDTYGEYLPYALGVCLAVGSFFALLLAGPANPFQIVPNPLPDGPGPNPLLQNHVLMMVHPPALYLGYVGMTIPFGIACAALLRGKLSDAWLANLRFWTLIAWGFLTIGIILGGWWAYEVLGWGGYWAWDPVENASFLPWLAATAYLHASVVQSRKQLLKAWTIALALGAFLLTILGTFMTRSGVFNSVHSFTQSAIGPAFLVFLGIAAVFSVALIATRAHLLQSDGRISALLSRDSAFIFNNILFTLLTFTVLLGTVFPLLTEAIQGTQVSVGEPYFNKMAVPIGMAIVFLMGVGPSLPWGNPKKKALAAEFVAPAIAGLGVIALAYFVFGADQVLSLSTFGLCGFAGYVTLRHIFGPPLQRMRRKGIGFFQSLRTDMRHNNRRVGGYIVHFGVIIMVVAIAASSDYRHSVEGALKAGESLSIGEFDLRFEGLFEQEHPHKLSRFAKLDVLRNKQSIDTAAPALNFYERQREPIGTPEVISFIDKDLYLSLMSYESDGSQVTLKAYIIPMVPWLWWALPFLSFGTLLAALPKKKRPRVLQKAPPQNV